MAAEVSVPAETGINSKHLDNLLSSEELSVIPKETANKIETYIDVKFEEFLTSKALYEAGRNTSAERIEKLENAAREGCLQYEHCKAKLEASEQTLTEIETQLSMVKAELGKTQESLKRQECDAEDFRRQRDSAVDERDNLMNLVERRNTEMEHLKADLAGVSSQLQTAINAKCEALSKNDEVQSKELSLKYKEQRIDQERTLLNSQIQSLTQELDRCTSELQTIRRNNSSRIMSLETQLSEMTEELSLANERINTLNDAKKSLTLKAESLSQKLMDQKEMERKMTENFQMELDAKTKLADLYSSMRVDNENKTEEMATAIIELQNMITETTTKYGQLETEKKQKEAEHEEILEKKNEAISALKIELENANELLQAAKNDSLNMALEDLSPSAAVTSKLIKSGMSLTQIYTQLVQVSDELMKEKEENKQLTVTLNSIVFELEEKAPQMKQQQEQYAETLENNAALRQQLDTLIMECNQLRDDYAECMKVSKHYQRENNTLKGEMGDLGRQVCFLLKEVELSRGGSFPTPDQDSSGNNAMMRETSENSSSRIISKKLVTFGDIQELQANNQKLLKLVRDLTDKHEENERVKDQLEAGELQSKVEELSNRVTELTDAQERQIKMVNSLIRQRDMYKSMCSKMKMDGNDVSMNMDTSDGSIDLNESHNKNATPTPQTSSNNTKEIEKLETYLAETKKQLEQQKTEFNTYKEEMMRNERMLIEQQETMHKELTALTASYTKCVAQAEYNNDRYKILQTNVATYKKQIASLEEKNKIYSATSAKQEIALKHLRDETLNAQSNQSKAEVMLENLKRECKFLKDSESRLQVERDVLNKERQNQALLLNNLELIKASLERNEGEGKIRLESRFDEANRECSALRRRLQEEQDRFRELASHLEKQTAQAKSRMEDEKKQADKFKAELATVREELTNKSNHIEELSKKLAAAINPLRIDGNYDSSKRLKELENQLAQRQSEIQALNKQIEVNKEHIQQYCDISEGAEKELKILHDEYSQYKSVTEEKLTNALQIQEQLKEKCSELEAELSLQTDGQTVTTSSLKKELVKAQEDLKAAQEDLNEKTTHLDEDRSKIAKLSEELQIAEEKYANEVVLHSNDIRALTSLKEQLSKLSQDINELTAAKEQAVDSLKNNEIAWKKHESMLSVEKEDMNSRITDLNKQNSLLMDQIQALGTQLAVAHSSKHSESFNESTQGGDVSMNRSINEDDVKSSDQLLQVIKYLRKECDITVAKFDIMQAEISRLKSQLEVTEKKRDEATIALMSEREKSEISTVTVTKHSEILRKVETLNAITDSNRILREERDSLISKVNDLSATSKRLEEMLSPLQEQNRELQTKVDALQSENVSLKVEASRWRNRVNALMERANKTRPEDWKRLQNERETLAKMLTSEKDNMKKSQEEATVMRLEKMRLEEQIQNLTKQHLVHAEEFKKQAEELNTLKKDISRVTQELGESKSTANAKSEEINKVNENIAAKEAVLADIRNKEMQIRKIAKKYKSQYEDLVKTVEEDKKKSELTATEAAVSSELRAEEKKVLEKKLEELEKSHSEQTANSNLRINTLLEEIESFRKEIEALRKGNNDNEDQAKEVMKQAKMRIVKLQEINTALNKELEDYKNKVKTFEQNTEENDTRYSLLKSQYDARLARLEKEKTESQQEKQQDVVRLNREIETLLQKVNQLQRQLSSQQTSKPSTSSGQGDKAVTEPPTANIKPMTGVGSQQSVGGRRPGGETPFASIRPMASHTTPRTAAVLPTSAQPPAPAHPTPAAPVSHHQTPHTTGSVLGDVALPSSSHHTTEYMPASSSAVGVRHHTHHARHPAPTPPESTQDMEAEVRAVEVASGNIPLVSPQTLAPTQTASAILPTTQQAVALVMPRMEPPAVAAHTHSDTQAAQHVHHPHHAHTHTHQQQASSSSSSNNSSSTVTTSHVPGAAADNTGTEAEAHRAHKRPRAPPDQTQKPTTNKRSRIQGFEGVSESDVEYQVPTSSQRDQEDEGVIVVDSDEENQYTEQYQDGVYSRMEIGEEEIDEEESDEEEGEGEEEEESGEGGEEEDGEGEGEGDGEEVEGEEEDNENEEREATGDNNEVDLVEETSRDMPAQSMGEDDVGGSGDVASDSLTLQREEQAESAAASVSPAPSPAPLQRQQIQSITSGTQGGNNSLMLSSVGSGVGSGVSGVYEEGDDGIVPSTPTLYVPRRNNDGFGEAVSSPVPGSSAGSTGGRFLFGDGGSGGSGGGGGGSGGEMESTHADLTAQLAPHQPNTNTTQGEVPSITVTEPCGESELEASSGAAVSSEAEVGSMEASASPADEDTPTVSSQGSQPASPQQMEEGREAEASASPSTNMRSHSAQETTPRGMVRGSTPSRHLTRSLHRPSPHHRRPTPITWASEADIRNNPYLQRGSMQQRGQRSRRPQPPFMRY